MDFSKIHLVEDLPISKFEEEIANKLLENSNLIVIGETGSGKTTQIPLIILKTLSKLQNLVAGKIAITEPRRIAATSVANYVATLVGDEIGKTVGYKIRFSEEKSNDTAMVFMTDGILLREAQSDPLLLDYSVVMVDEAHERNVNSDFLIGLLVDIQKKRRDLDKIPLKILVTSATLEKEKFIKFFNQFEDEKHDIVEVPGRLFPVEMHLEQKDIWRYEEKAADVVDLICKSNFEDLKSSIQNNTDISARKESRSKSSDIQQNKGDILIFMPGKGEIERTKTAIMNLVDYEDLNLEIITVHADLPIEEQNRIFKKSDKRKVIIATNIAETSLTVPGVVYVIDSGLIKVMEFNPNSGINSLITKEHAKKGLEQRKGRAGRIEAGVYFGLYTQKSLERREEFPIPEILRTSLSQIILIMKIIGISDIRNFHFIDHPDNFLIASAIRELQSLGALDNIEDITQKGQTMASLPLEPRLSNLIIEANKNKCIETVCTIASFLELKPVMLNQTLDDIFNNLVEIHKREILENDQKNIEKTYKSLNEIEIDEVFAKNLYRKAEVILNDMEIKQRNLQYKGSDFFTLLKIYRAWEKTNFDEYWPDTQYLNTQTLLEAKNIREELLDICDQNGFDPIDKGGSELNFRVEKTFILAFKFNILSQMPTGFYKNTKSKEKNIRIHNSSVLRNDKPKFALAFEVIEINEIDSEPKLSAKFLHAISSDLIKQLFPEIYKTEMKLQKNLDRERFSRHGKFRNNRGGKGSFGHKLERGHVGRRSNSRRSGHR